MILLRFDLKHKQHSRKRMSFAVDCVMKFPDRNYSNGAGVQIHILNVKYIKEDY